jgi:hypothetical protein
MVKYGHSWLMKPNNTRRHDQDEAPSRIIMPGGNVDWPTKPPFLSKRAVYSIVEQVITEDSMQSQPADWPLFMEGRRCFL